VRTRYPVFVWGPSELKSQVCLSYLIKKDDLECKALHKVKGRWRSKSEMGRGGGRGRQADFCRYEVLKLTQSYLLTTFFTSYCLLIGTEVSSLFI
jgi:hypothetical protein